MMEALKHLEDSHAELKSLAAGVDDIIRAVENQLAGIEPVELIRVDEVLALDGWEDDCEIYKDLSACHHEGQHRLTVAVERAESGGREVKPLIECPERVKVEALGMLDPLLEKLTEHIEERNAMIRHAAGMAA